MSILIVAKILRIDRSQAGLDGGVAQWMAVAGQPTCIVYGEAVGGRGEVVSLVQTLEKFKMPSVCFQSTTPTSCTVSTAAVSLS